MDNYTFFRSSKILGEAGKREILQQMFRNSRSQIVLRTDNSQKLSSGAPEKIVKNQDGGLTVLLFDR